MSGQYVRLPDSKRNELIANFQAGITDPNYEVIPSKTTVGRYTIRKRKVTLPVSEQEHQEVPQIEQPPEQPPEEQEEENPYLNDASYFPAFKMNKNAMFREMQMQMNRMFIEQMKMMRQQVKQTEKKREKLKNKSKRITDILTNIVNEAEKEEQEEQKPEEPTEEEEKVEVPETPKQEPQQTPKAGDILKEMAPPEKQYANSYEKNIDKLAGDVYRTIPSRRSRLHTEKFGI